MSESGGAAQNGGTMSPGCLTALGIFMILAGFAAILSPWVASAAATLALGWLLVIGGIVRAVWAFMRTSEGWTKVLIDLAIGALYIIAGIVIVNNMLTATVTLTFLLGVVFLVQGAFELIEAWRLRPAAEWKWLTFGGVVALLLGLMILANFPSSAVWAIGLLLGVNLLFSGFGMLFARRIPGALGGTA